MKRSMLMLALAMVPVVTGCTTTSTPTSHVAVSSEDRGMIRNNKQQPQWAVDMVRAKDDENYYFVSIVERSYKLSLGIDKAKTDALGNIAQQIGTDIVKMASKADTGDLSVAGGAQEAFDSATGALSKASITGASVEDLYWEEIRGKPGESSYYSISVLVAVPKAEIARAAKIWLDKFNKSNAAQPLKEEVKKKVSEYSDSTEKQGVTPPPPALTPSAKDEETPSL